MTIEPFMVSVKSKDRRITVAFSFSAKYEQKDGSGGMDLCRRCLLSILRKAKI